MQPRQPSAKSIGAHAACGKTRRRGSVGRSKADILQLYGIFRRLRLGLRLLPAPWKRWRNLYTATLCVKRGNYWFCMACSPV